MTRNITRPLGRPPVRLGERMHVRIKDIPGTLLAAVVSCHHRLQVVVLANDPVWRGAVLSEGQFVEVKR
jgi:hypothetical protein